MKSSLEIAKQGLPLSSFPPSVRDFITGFSESTKAPPSFVAAGVLACATGVCSRYSMEVKPGYRERPNLFIAVVGHPGVSKSPPINAALYPLCRIDEEKNKEYRKDMKEYKELLKKPSKDRLPGEPPESEPSEMITDGSVEGLISNLSEMYDQDKKPHCVYLRDELKGHFGGMNKYKSGGGDDYEMWLQLYTGATVSKRLKKETIFIPSARCSVIGGIQPDIYIEHMQDKGDGMVDRFLVAYYDGDPSKTDIYATVDPSIMVEYNHFMSDLHESIGICYRPWDLPFDERDEVLASFDDFLTWTYETGMQYDCGAFKKWEQNFYRILIILASMWGKSELDIDVVEKAKELSAFFAVDWIKSRILSDGEGEDKSYIRAKKMIEKAGDVGMAKRDFVQGSKLFRGLEGKILLDKTLRKIVASGGSTLGSDRRYYCV